MPAKIRTNNITNADDLIEHLFRALQASALTAISSYRYMQQIFDQARIALRGTSDAREQREILRLLGEAALAEQVEWALMHRQRPLEHNRI